MIIRCNRDDVEQNIEDLPKQLWRIAARKWMFAYDEAFPSNWEIASVNFNGDMIDLTFRWVD